MWINQWQPVIEQQTAQDEVAKMYDKYQGHMATQYEQELAKRTVEAIQALPTVELTAWISQWCPLLEQSYQTQLMTGQRGVTGPWPPHLSSILPPSFTL